jgi:hypothetical protein
MSDLRNFGSSNDKMTMSENIPETNLGAPAQFLDTGGLSNFHHPVEDEKANSNTARMIGAAVVVVMLCGAGAYAYMSSSSMSKSPVAGSAATSAPQSVAANTPAAPAMQTTPVPSDNSALANSPYGSAPAGKMDKLDKSAPAAIPASAPEDTTVVKHRVKTARADRAEKKEVTEDKQEAQTTNQLNAQESTTVTQQNTASASETATATAPASANDNVASSTPLPTPPAAPSSSVASNGQPATSTPQNVAPVPGDTTAQPAPTTPAPATPAPDASTQQPSQAQPAQAQPQ